MFMSKYLASNIMGDLRYQGNYVILFLLLLAHVCTKKVTAMDAQEQLQKKMQANSRSSY